MNIFFTNFLSEIVWFLCDIFYLVRCLFLLSSSLAKAPSSNLSMRLQRRHIKECFLYFSSKLNILSYIFICWYVIGWRSSSIFYAIQRLKSYFRMSMLLLMKSSFAASLKWFRHLVVSKWIALVAKVKTFQMFSCGPSVMVKASVGT